MRFYSNKYPSKDEIVTVRLLEKTKDCLQVYIIEYDIDAIIIYKEVARRLRKININKIFNKPVECLVLDVDEEKGFVNLSYMRVLPEEREKKQQEFIHLERIHKIGYELKELYNKTMDDNIDEEDMYKETIWKIFDNHDSDYETLYELLIKEPKEIFKYSTELPNQFINNAITMYKKRLAFSKIVSSYDFMLTVFTENAIDNIKKILSTIDNYNKDIKVEYVASPKYKLIITGDNIEEIKEHRKNIEVLVNDIMKNIRGKYKINRDMKIVKKRVYYLHPLIGYLKSLK